VFSEELRDLLFRVITSWQVIVVTVVLILYFLLVFYVARLRRRSRPITMEEMPKRARNSGKDKSAESVEVTEEDDLGLEEEQGF
jgi:flagellar biosynthesis/type III secretory pathway M-ring protein FliF/YscJ